MWYFAYDWRADWRLLEDRGRRTNQPFRSPRTTAPAVLRNYRLCFPAFSSAWAGGAASLAYEPGKSVSGVLFEIGPSTLKMLNAVARDATEQGGVAAVTRTVSVELLPNAASFGDSGPTVITATTHELGIVERTHVPPSNTLVNEMIRTASRLGHSEMWLAHLRSLAPVGPAAYEVEGGLGI